MKPQYARAAEFARFEFYLRSKISATLNMFTCITSGSETFRCAEKKLADSAAKLLKNPRDVPERAALEVFIAANFTASRWTTGNISPAPSPSAAANPKRVGRNHRQSLASGGLAIPVFLAMQNARVLPICRSFSVRAAERRWKSVREHAMSTTAP